MDKAQTPRPVDADQFRLGMRTLAAAVTIITSSHAGHRHGMTATAVCSVSAEPPTLLACMNKATSTLAAVTKSGAFCVNLLRAEDWELSTAFSGAQSGETRFRSREWTHLATGSPVLIDALASFDCRVVKTLAQGSHSVVFGRVEQVVFGKKGKPLLYADGHYAKLASLSHGEPLPAGLDYWGV